MSHNQKLKNAPLKEVILEITWEDSIDEFGNKFDSGFELAQGIFAEKLKEKFPIHKKLYNNNQQVKFGTPIHQYWMSELEWPVIQHGQGILSINQTEDKYLWNDFKNLVNEIVGLLFSSYSDNILINRISLEYFDAFDVPDSQTYKFIEDNLQTSLCTQYNLPGQLDGLKINKNYLQEDNSLLSISISDAVNDFTKKEVVIMVTSGIIEENNLNENFDSKLEKLHKLCSDAFKTILNKDYYGSLN